MKLFSAQFKAIGIAIDDDNETGIDSATSKGSELTREPLNDELDRGTLPARQRHAPKFVILPSHLLEEPRHKRLLLLVFAKQNNLGSTPHTSQPRAISSE